MFDLIDKTISCLIQPQTLAASLNGPAIDLVGLEGMATVLGSVGTPGNGTGTLSLQLQTSADGATGWTNIGPVLGAFTTAGGVINMNLNPAACLRYIRAVAMLGGTSPSFPLAVFCIGSPQYY